MTSKIKVDNINKVSDDSNIIKKCGTTITLGASGDSIALASGASQSGFGRTGTVDWQTSIKTSTITAVNGEGYFVNTTGGAITANLPAGVVGAIVSFKDYAQNFDTNALTIAANGSEKIDGQTFDLVLNTEGVAVTLVYGDATKGWQTVNSNEVVNTVKYVAATGGTSSTCGDYKIHTFTGPGTLCVSCAGNAAGNDQIEYLVVAGGGGAGAYATGVPGAGGGGGAGGLRFASPSISPLTYPAKPIAGSTITVTAGAIPVAVGGGGAGQVPPGTANCSQSAPGSVSTFSSITSTGGGGTTNGPTGSPQGAGLPGGSGGGQGGTGLAGTGGSGNTPPVSPPQGNDGGSYTSPGGPKYATGGGGGAMAVGQSKNPHNDSVGGNGGAGAGFPTAFGSNGESCGSYRYYGGGGAGSSYYSGPPAASAGTGGVGGGANGLVGPGTGGAGTANTGGGGGGQAATSGGSGGAGGSGIVVIRYKFQN